VVAQGGTSISSSSVRVAVVSTPGPSGPDGTLCERVGGVGTLLGPEGAGDIYVERFVSAGTPEGVLSYVWDWPDIITQLVVTLGCGWCLCGLVLPVA
jgi:hypothetical protein